MNSYCSFLNHLGEQKNYEEVPNGKGLQKTFELDFIKKQKQKQKKQSKHTDHLLAVLCI